MNVLLKRFLTILVFAFTCGLVLKLNWGGISIPIPKMVSMPDQQLDVGTPVSDGKFTTSVPKLTNPVAVLFTTFKKKTEKEFIYNNTLQNWASFLPFIQPVLFSTFTNATILRYAHTCGWTVIPCPKVNDQGTPFLKEMYLDVYRRFPRASLYAFSNGDILFDHGLLKTLQRAIAHFDIHNTKLIVGRRWNLNVNKDIKVYEKDPLWKPDKVTAIAKPKISSLFRVDAEDYFFLTRDFPWDKVKDVVIGRVAYDNYLVGRALQLKATTIDATNTIRAVHQTGSDGNYAGHTKENKDKGYNLKVIGRFPYHTGHTTSCWFRSKWVNDTVEFVQVHGLPKTSTTKPTLKEQAHLNSTIKPTIKT